MATSKIFANVASTYSLNGLDGFFSDERNVVAVATEASTEGGELPTFRDSGRLEKRNDCFWNTSTRMGGERTVSTNTQARIAENAEVTAKRDADDCRSAAAWIDSDDERVTLDISKFPKLRKLRRTSGETELSVGEIQRRLQSVHTTLNNSYVSATRKVLSQSWSGRRGEDATSFRERFGDENTPRWVEVARKRKKMIAQQFKSVDLDESVSSSEEYSYDNEDISYVALHNPVTGQDKMLSRSDSLIVQQKETNKSVLPHGSIEIKQLGDANKAEYCNGPIRSVQFHCNSSILFCTSSDKTLRIFQIDEKESQKVELIRINKYPITEAKFSNEYQRILMLSNRKAFVEYDLHSGGLNVIPGVAGRQLDKYYTHLSIGPSRLESGGSTSSLFAVSTDKDGYVLLCDSMTKRLVQMYKMNAGCAGIAFHPERNSILTADKDSYVYEWDVRAGRCLSRFQDACCLNITSFNASRREPYLLATGSRTGYLSLFSLRDKQLKADPIKSFGNLTTAVTATCFHPSSEIFCYASKYKRDAIRMVHLPSLTVYSNWPSGLKFSSGFTSLDFSQHYGYLAAGNQLGQLQLFQLKHFA